MAQITQITGTGMPLVLDDIDTDRIIPARYLRCVSFEGIGEHAFKDDRQQDAGHPFNQPQFQGASILVVGRNFGCGSSREHAPQSLMRWGISAIIGESFAEIFFGNCTSLGIPCVTADRPALVALGKLIEADPVLEITLDLELCEVNYADVVVPVKMVAGARDALVSGQWDFLGQLLEHTDEIRQTASQLPYVSRATPA
ncbi:MAG: 3-isopropylmalate dehydratase small subunit [Planctomycetaceae bacterium]|nr:3-isopropylmalate dehydratase small subunit [Planctomycetaceae bacterium]